MASLTRRSVAPRPWAAPATAAEFGVPALDSVQGSSMGEAWSDWYAFDLLVREGNLTDTSAPGSSGTLRW